jgi:uncharacterized delta-60 repeat protein
MKKSFIVITTLLSMGFTAYLFGDRQPAISRLYGTPYAGGVAVSQDSGTVGAVDESFGTSGSISLATELSGGQAKAIKVLNDGSMVVGLSKSATNSVVVKYTATGAVESSANFGTSGVADLGTTATLHSLIVDEQERTIVCGGNISAGSTGYLKRVSADGDTVLSYDLSGNAWRFIGAVAQQSTGDYIVVGADSSNNPRLARYSQGSASAAGVLDTNFGVSGFRTIPTSAGGLYNVYVHSDDTIFVAFGVSNASDYDVYVRKFDANGSVVTGWGSSGSVQLSYLTGTAAELDLSQIRMVANADDLIVGCTKGSPAAFYASSKTIASAAGGTFANLTFSLGGDACQLCHMMVDANGKVYFAGSSTTDITFVLARATAGGVLDTAGFNASTGYKQFAVGTPDTSAVLYGASIAPDGRVFTAGYQVNSGTTTPYVSAVYGNQYIGQRAQFPASAEQGTFDEAFGADESDDGIVRTFQGIYGSSLNQKARSIIKLSDDTLLIAQDGKLDNSNYSNMVLTRLNGDGTADTSFALAKTYTNEYITSVTQGITNSYLYVTGYSSNGEIILRKFNNSATLQWDLAVVETAESADYDLSGTNYKAFGVVIQAAGQGSRILLFKQVSATVGQISAHLPASGILDTSFNAAGDTPGFISTADFSASLANMGPVVGFAMDENYDIYIAYKNSATGYVDVAKINHDGSGLVDEFGTSGIVANVFAGVTPTTTSDIGLALDNQNRLIVAVASGTNYYVAAVIASHGDLDDSFGTSGIASFTSMGTATILKRLTTLDDNSILLTGSDNATDDSMIVIKLDSDGAYDTSFNAQGATPGLASLQLTNTTTNYQSRVATGLAVNADGDFIVCGYEEPSAYESVPMAFKLYGESGRSQVAQFVQSGSQDHIGTINTTYGTNGLYDLSTVISNGQASLVYSYPSGNTHQGKILVAVDGGADTILARVYEHNMSLDTSFSSDGKITLSGKTGLETILVDGDNKILLGGGNGGTAWITRIPDNGGSQSIFSVPVGFKKVYDIKNQQSGRYIFSGTDTSDLGAVGALRDTGVVDTTFNPLGAVPGVYQFGVGITAVPSIAINEDDTILAAYKDTQVKIAKLQMHGAALVNGFGSSGVKNSSITPTDALSIRLALDSNAKIVLATSAGDNSVSLVRYSSSGATTDFATSIVGIGDAGVALHRLIVDENNKIILLGENTNAGYGANGSLYAVRIDAAGSLDATWNSSPAGVDVAGILTYDINGTTNAFDGALFIDGTLYVAAYVNDGAENVPALISIFGDDSSTEVDQQPYETAAGIIDLTLDASGSLNLATEYSMAGVAKSSHIFADGSQLIASSNGTNSYVTKLKADFTLDDSFGSTGVATISGKDNISDMFVANGTDDDASIFVCGDDAGAMWAAKISADGATVTQVTVPSVSAGTTLTNGYVIRQSTNGRVLVGGVTSTSGVIAAFKSDLSGMDVSFGNGSGTGYYRTGDANPIVDMAVDSYDRIYVARKDANAGSPIIKVQRLFANGTAVDTSFGSGTITISQTAALQGTTVRCALDASNDRLVVAVQDGTSTNNVWKIRRYSTVDGAAKGSLDTVTITSKVINLRALLIDSDEYIYAVGYNSTDGYGVVARIESTGGNTIGLDTTFATTGIANLNTGSMTIVSSASLHPDRRIRLYGQNGDGSAAYAARVFGDDYNSQVTEEIFRAQDGAIDQTIDAADNANGVALLQDVSGWSALDQVYAVHALADGSLLFATCNGTNLVIAKSNADLSPDTSFSTDGLTSAVAFVTVDSMIVDADGKIVVSGTGAADAQKVVRFTSAGAVDTTFSSSLSCTYGNQVVEQKSGRYLVAGYKGSAGSVNAYRSTGVDDITYGPAANAGWYATGVDAVVKDIVLDSNDNAYIAYIDTTVKLEKISANGSEKVAAFGSGAAVNTGISGTGVVKLAINSAGNILVAATTSAGVVTRLYNGSTGAAIAPAQLITDTNTPILGDVAVDTDNDFVVAVYTTTSGQESVKVIRLVAADGTVDSSFGTSGVTATTSDSAAFAYGVSIRPDGKILVGGGDINNDPIVFQVYGDSYIAQTEQFPGKEAAGLLDTTLYPTSGALNLDDRVTVTGLNGSAVKRMYEYGDGRMLLVCENGSDTILMRLYKDLTIDTTFNAVGYLTISGKTTARGLFVDADGQIFVAGGATTSWVRAYTSAGAALSGWVTPTQNLSGGAYEILQQSCERTILAGQNTNGTLYGYTTSGILDQSFGSAGVVDTGVAFPIADMSIDSTDRILIVHVDGSGNSVLKRVSNDGDSIATLAGTALTNVSGDKLRVVQDGSGNIVVGAATTTGFKLRAYDSTGADRAGSNLITINTGHNTMHIANLYVTSDDKTVLVGYNTTNNNIIVARINAAFSALDSTFNGGAVLSTTIGDMNLVYDAVVHTDNRITLGGGASGTADPYLGRVFGDSYVTTVNQFRAEGVAGVIDTTHGTSGTLNYGSVAINFGTSTGKAIINNGDGGYYLAMDNSSGSKITKMTSSNTLDTTFNADGYADNAPAGVAAMIMDGSGRLVTVGTDGSSAGWIYRLDTNGDADTSFGSSGVTSVASSSANAVVELTLGRLVVAGKRTNGCLRAYTDAGELDITFNSLGSTPGEYSLSGNTNGIYALVADEYDQLIVAVLNAAGNAVDLMRFRSSGVLDTSFGTNGVITGAIANASGDSHVRVAINPAGNIVVAARVTNDGGTTYQIVVKTYDNLVAASGNGVVVNSALTISSLITPSLKNMIVDADGYVYLLGGQNGTSGDIWIARLVISGSSAVALDTTGFNPSGMIPGIFTYAKQMADTGHTYSGISIRYDGRLSVLGSVNNSVQLLRVYNTPYTSQEDQFPGIMATGTNDLTFGRAGENMVEFYALAGTDADENQVARAVSMPDNNNYLIALDGKSTVDSTSRVFLNLFNIDGTLNTTFNTTGQQELLSSTYENKYVNDMITFTTVDAVQKALVAGYVYNSTLSVYNSLLLQYNIDNEGLDSTFGGFDGDPSGVAFGDGKRMNVVGRQTTGRVITGGLDQSDYGLVLGFTADGKLDKSFGSDGYFVQGTTGVYAMAVTAANKVVVGYNDGSNNVAVAQILADGSGLDTAFGTSGVISAANRISGISGNTNLRVALRTDDKIIAAAVNNGGADCVLRKYSTIGALETSLTVASASLGNVSNLVISKMLLDTNNNIVVAAYGTIGGAQKIIVFRVLADLSGLDTTAFNSPSGYVAYTTGEAQTPIHMLIQDDGRITIVGSHA